MPRSEEETVFPSRLALAMRLQDITRSELAERVGVSRMTIHAWVSGTSSPTVPKLKRLAEELQVTTAYLLGHEASLKLPPYFKRYQAKFLSTEGLDKEETQKRFEDFHEYLTFIRNRTSRNRPN